MCCFVTSFILLLIHCLSHFSSREYQKFTLYSRGKLLTKSETKALVVKETEIIQIVFISHMNESILWDIRQNGINGWQNHCLFCLLICVLCFSRLTTIHLVLEYSVMQAKPLTPFWIIQNISSLVTMVSIRKQKKNIFLLDFICKIFQHCFSVLSPWNCEPGELSSWCCEDVWKQSLS